MTAGRQLTAALLVLASGIWASAEEPLGLVSVDRQRRVVGMPGETEIAASPEGQQIVIGTNRPQDAAPATLDRRTVFFSANSGETFEASTLIETAPRRSLKDHRDPTVAWAGSGNFYYSAMGSTADVRVGRSTDGGQSLTPTASVAGDCQAFYGVSRDDCITDQPHLAADPRKPDSGDQLYLVWRASRNTGPATAVIECSTDNGDSWTTPKAVWELDKGEFPRLTVDAKGRVWVVLVESRFRGQIRLQRFSPCADGLQPEFVSWGRSSPIVVTDFDGEFCVNGSNFISGLDRCNDGNVLVSPTVAVDPGNTDRVFVTWAQRKSGIDAEIVTVADERGGRDGFPLRIRVDGDAGRAARFLPYSCASGGQVFVGWYDRRHARAGLATNDFTDYYVGAVGIRDRTLVRVPEAQVTFNSDPQCTTWPVASRHKETAEACTRQPQLAGRLSGGGSPCPCSANQVCTLDDVCLDRCDFSDTSQCADARGVAKYGDYNGIGCTDGGAYLTWASHVPPLRAAGRPPPRAGELSVYFARATADREAAAEQARGDAFIYQLSNDGKIEKPLQQAKVDRGTTIVAPFGAGLGSFLFLLNTENPRFRVRNMTLTGTLGDEVDSKALTAGWTSVLSYNILGTTYVFMYKASNGQVKVRRVGVDGVVAPSSSSPTQDLGAGWTSINHYAVGLDNFLIFVNRQSGAMRVRRVNADGLVNTATHQSATWTTGYTTVKPFSTSGGNFLFKLKVANGTMHVERINDDGTTGSIVDNQTFDTGFFGIPYSVAGGTFVFLHNPDTGVLRIRRINDDGTVGDVTEEEEFTPGWRAAAIYTVGLGKYLILIKP